MARIEIKGSPEELERIAIFLKDINGAAVQFALETAHKKQEPTA